MGEKGMIGALLKDMFKSRTVYQYRSLKKQDVNDTHQSPISFKRTHPLAHLYE